ncbi:hypothetical protein LCGC14_0325630 [marine sediment metagenome]|uniref:J domain-containing protein n=1 Tax=marine sediment metagenome TaxID=412755 RepID=A0A0F9U0D3_9ZZZZ
MSGFDAYHKWLGIPPKEQPPSHYRLLGIALHESDLDVIDHAADQRMIHLQTFQMGEHGHVSQQLLNEVSAARKCLLDSAKKRHYDEGLKCQAPRNEVQPKSFCPLCKESVHPEAIKCRHCQNHIPPIPPLPAEVLAAEPVVFSELVPEQVESGPQRSVSIWNRSVSDCLVDFNVWLFLKTARTIKRIARLFTKKKEDCDMDLEQILPGSSALHIDEKDILSEQFPMLSAFNDEPQAKPPAQFPDAKLIYPPYSENPMTKSPPIIRESRPGELR